MCSRTGRAGSGANGVQRLPPEGAFHCEGCGRLTLFRFVRSRRSTADERKVYAYLVCPTCGQRAVQVRWARRLPEEK